MFHKFCCFNLSILFIQILYVIEKRMKYIYVHLIYNLNALTLKILLK